MKENAVLLIGQLREFEVFLHRIDLSLYEVVVVCTAECFRRHGNIIPKSWHVITEENCEFLKESDDWAARHMPALRQWVKFFVGARYLGSLHSSERSQYVKILKLRTDTNVTQESIEDFFAYCMTNGKVYLDSDKMFLIHGTDLNLIGNFWLSFPEYFRVDYVLTRDHREALHPTINKFCKIDWIYCPLDFLTNNPFVRLLCRGISSLGFELVSSKKPFYNDFSSEQSFVKYLVDLDMELAALGKHPTSLVYPKHPSSASPMRKELANLRALIVNLRVVKK